VTCRLRSNRAQYRHCKFEKELARIAAYLFKFERPGLDWDNLKVFLTVAAAGSLAGAARRLRISQATVWRRITALEASLDTQLFERRPEGYVLAAAGSAFLRSLDGVQRTIETAGRELVQSPVGAEGEVRVIAPEFPGQMLGERLASLARRHPRLVIELLTGSPAASIMAREVDIALRVERLPSAGFALEAVVPIPFQVYAAPSYLKRFGAPRAIDDFKGHRLIDFDRSWAHIAPRPWQKSGGRGATVAFRSNSPHARLAAVRAGLGLVLLPELMARNQADLKVVLSAEVVGTLDLMMYVAVSLRREPRVIAARDFLVELLGEATSPQKKKAARGGLSDPSSGEP
jgi:DNA-binding transcriptional LysR family regulator